MALEASEVAVRVRLVGGSAFQTDADKVAASTEKIGAAGKKANADAATAGLTLGAAGSKLTSVGNKMISFGKTLTMVGIPLAAVGVYASRAASGFQQQMMLLSTQAGEAQRNLGWMSNSVFTMSKQFGQLPAEMAKGLYNFESVGIHGKAALNDIKAAAMGSAVGLDSLGNTTDAVSTIMKSKITGVGGPVQAMAMLDQAVGRGKMHLQDLTESFKSGIIPLAQQFHLDLPSVLGSISALSAVGTPPSQVAARMRLMLTSMEALSPGAEKALHHVGIGPYDLANDLSGPGHLVGALSDLKSHLALLPGPQQNAILAAIFGRSRGMGQIAGSLSQLDALTSDVTADKAAGPSLLQRHLQQTEQTTAFKSQQLRAQFNTDMIQLGQTINTRILPVLIRLIPLVQGAVNVFGRLPRPIQDFLLAMAGLVIVGGPLFMFGGALVKGAGMFLSGIETIVGASGMGALRAGIAMTVGEMTGPLFLAMAGAAAYFALFHTKAGKKAVHSAEQYVADNGFALGIALRQAFGGNVTGALVQHYEKSDQFKAFNPAAQSDLQLLWESGMNSYAAHHMAATASDLARSHVNVDQIPGLSSQLKEALKAAMKEAPVNVYLPNGRLLAQSVNEVNRKSQNRR